MSREELEHFAKKQDVRNTLLCLLPAPPETRQIKKEIVRSSIMAKREAFLGHRGEDVREHKLVL